MKRISFLLLATLASARYTRENCESNGDCQNGGKCEDNFCRCMKDTNGDNCQIIVECNNRLQKCTGNLGICTYDRVNEKAVCTCRDTEKHFDEKLGECRKNCESNGDCQNGGKCEDNFCRCMKDTTGDNCETIVDCNSKLQRCSGNVGICTYDTGKDKAVCTCIDPEKHFDETLGECRKNCESNGDCQNGGKCEDNFCRCMKDTNGDYCEIIVECNNKLQNCAGNVGSCTYDAGNEKAVCTCIDTEKHFDEKLGECRKRCISDNDCQHDGKCTEEKFCKCAPGTSGDKCEKVDGCTDEFVQLCESEDGKCQYDTNAANHFSCVCNNNKVFSGKNCVVPCEDNCRNGGTCTGTRNLRFCECLKGTAGDLCNDITGCTDNFCGSGEDVECAFDPKSLKPKCECSDPQKQFEAEAKMCKDACWADRECYNGAACVDYVCRCLSGTTGEKCQVIDECNTKFKMCKEEVGDCRYDVEKKAAECTCKETEKAFDAESGICRDTCDPNPCQHGGKCIYDGKGIKCECRDPYSGDNCQIDPCEPNPCRHEGYCVHDGKGKKCKCEDPYYGDICEIECNCGRNGTCIFDNYGQKKCICYEGFKEFKGKCEECNCGRNGTCIFDNYGQKKCICDEGFKEFKGKCEECNCERNGTCFFENYKKKMCICDVGFREFRGQCKECYCGRDSMCTFDSYGSKNCYCPDEYAEFEGLCKMCSCGLNSKCSFDSHGDKRCYCPAGSIAFEETCRPCYCGRWNISCVFDSLGYRKCLCPDGFAEFMGRCKKCDCGEWNVTCTFDSYGQKHCLCPDGFAEFEGVCKKCKCGRNSECFFDIHGNKQCYCQFGFIEFEGECKECNCGNFTCSLDWRGHMRCTCEEGFAEFNGDCKECNCGQNSMCSFDWSGRKQCTCGNGFSEFNGTCKACNCGYYSLCSFDRMGQKRCTCNEGFIEFRGLCKECSCGRHSLCLLDRKGDQYCVCEDGYAEINGNCKDVCDTYPCIQGICKKIPGKGAACECYDNYRGIFCDVRDEKVIDGRRDITTIPAILGAILVVLLISFLVFTCILCRKK